MEDLRGGGEGVKEQEGSIRRILVVFVYSRSRVRIFHGDNGQERGEKKKEKAAEKEKKEMKEMKKKILALIHVVVRSRLNVARPPYRR